MVPQQSGSQLQPVQMQSVRHLPHSATIALIASGMAAAALAKATAAATLTTSFAIRHTAAPRSEPERKRG